MVCRERTHVHPTQKEHRGSRALPMLGPAKRPSSAPWPCRKQSPPRHGERLRLQLLFKLADTENLSILAVNAWAVTVLAVSSVSSGVSHIF